MIVLEPHFTCRIIGCAIVSTMLLYVFDCVTRVVRIYANILGEFVGILHNLGRNFWKFPIIIVILFNFTNICTYTTTVGIDKSELQ